MLPAATVHVGDAVNGLKGEPVNETDVSDASQPDPVTVTEVEIGPLFGVNTTVGVTAFTGGRRSSGLYGVWL